MGIQTQTIDNLIKHIKLSIHTGMPARVVAYNEAKREADIELLFMQVDVYGNEVKYPLIVGVPVMGMRYKVKQSFSAEVGGLKYVGNAVDGGAATIKPTEEIELVPSLRKDDVVWVSFAERALDNLTKQPFNPEFKRMFDVRDAVVLGIFGM